MKIAKLTDELINFIQFKFLLRKYYIRPGLSVAVHMCPEFGALKNEENLHLIVLDHLNLIQASVKYEVIQMDINFLM